METVIYGIPNCDTVKKARRWLDEHGVIYRFHDLREDGLVEQQLRGWLEALGWEQLINRRSTSWKALSAADREAMDNHSAVRHILAAPTLIKRPLLEHGKILETGFSAARYGELFAA
jgi:Spx/MgsR family transcriptional regulator